METLVAVVIAIVLLGVFLIARRGRAEKVNLTQELDEAFMRADANLKAINKRLGFAEGQGPTGIMVDGQYQIVNVGQTERMKDQNYRRADEIAGLLLKMTNLEAALTEAQASGNRDLEELITREMASIEKIVMGLAEQMKL